MKYKRAKRKYPFKATRVTQPKRQKKTQRNVEDLVRYFGRMQQRENSARNTESIITNYVSKVCSSIAAKCSRFLPILSIHHKKKKPQLSQHKEKIRKNLSSSPNQENVLDHYSEESPVTPDKGFKSTTGDRNIFEESGLSEELVNSFCLANISHFNQKRVKFDLEETGQPL